MMKLWSSVPRAHMWMEEQEQLLPPEHSHRWGKVCRETTDVPFHLQIIWENIRLESWESVAIAMRQMNRFHRHTHTHLLGSNLPAAAASWLPLPQTSGWQPLTPCREGAKLHQQRNFGRAGIRGRTNATFQPICACRASAGSNELASLHSTPTLTRLSLHPLRPFHTPSHDFSFLQQSWSEEPLKPQLPPPPPPPTPPDLLIIRSH